MPFIWDFIHGIVFATLYYRILYVIDDGNYAFTISKTPTKGSISRNPIINSKIADPIRLNRLITIPKRCFDSLSSGMGQSNNMID